MKNRSRLLVGPIAVLLLHSASVQARRIVVWDCPDAKSCRELSLRERAHLGQLLLRARAAIRRPPRAFYKQIRAAVSFGGQITVKSRRHKNFPALIAPKRARLDMVRGQVFPVFLELVEEYRLIGQKNRSRLIDRRCGYVMYCRWREAKRHDLLVTVRLSPTPETASKYTKQTKPDRIHFDRPEEVQVEFNRGRRGIELRLVVGARSDHPQSRRAAPPAPLPRGQLARVAAVVVELSGAADHVRRLASNINRAALRQLLSAEERRSKL